MAKRKEKTAYTQSKRKFYGNRYTKKHKETVGNEESSSNIQGASERTEQCDMSHRQADVHQVEDSVIPQPSASSTKLGPRTSQVIDNDEELTGFRFVDIKLLVNFINSLLCSHCRRPLGEKNSHMTEDRSSLASKLTFHCQCQHKLSFMSSAKCGKTYEVNRRYPCALFAIGGTTCMARHFLEI
jgi:hypothetical protein